MVTPTVAPVISKEHPDLPDHYGMSVEILGRSEPVKIEVASHLVIDKVWLPVEQEVEVKDEAGNPKKNEAGNIIKEKVTVYVPAPAPAPYMEVITKDNEYKIIPFSCMGPCSLDLRYSKIVALREKKKQELKTANK